MPKYRVYEIEEDKVMITGVYKTRAVLRAIWDIDFDTLEEAEKKLVDSLLVRGNYTILPIYHNKNHNLETTINKKNNHTMRIYLTEAGKKEIEAEIDELNRFIQDPDSIYTYPLLFNECQIMIDVDKQILSSATILPDEVEKLNGNW